MIEVNGRSYSIPTGAPRVAICLDGSDPAYLEDALSAGLMPALARWVREGAYTIGRAAFPTFTNPNNVSIVTGVAPSRHGISGNHFFDRTRGADVPMNEPSMLRAETIPAALARAGVRVLAVTAKDKLVRLIDPGGPRGSAFSSESPGASGRALGLTPPGDVYSADASLFVLDAGIAALSREPTGVLYLSTTDYVQHKHPPGSPEARAFYAQLDVRLARLDALGAIVALTADHGMNAKVRADGSPNVLYLSPLLPGAHVTLPITDPYVRHHGALGGAAWIDLGRDAPPAPRALEEACTTLTRAEGVEAVHTRAEAASRLELPADRVGDLVVVAARDYVLGKAPAEHDLTHVGLGLRSHGSLHEAPVPIALNRRVDGLAPGTPNRDLFHLLLDRAQAR